MQSEAILDEIVVSDVPWYRVFGEDIIALVLVAATVVVGLMIWRRCIADRRWLDRLLLPLVPVVPLISVVLLIEFFQRDAPEGLFLGVQLLYGMLFGACTLAPLASDPHRAIRMLAMTSLPILLYMLAHFLLADANASFRIVVLSASVIVIMGLAISVVLIAPLQVSRRYWLYMILVGLGAGFSIGYCSEHYFCMFRSCPDWYVYLLLIPFALTPIMFSAAVAFGLQRNG